MMMMDWPVLAVIAAYSGLSLLSLLLWWLIYEVVLTPGLPVLEALFGRRPNPAVAFDVLAGLFALAILNFAVISAPALGSLVVDLEATALTLLGTIVLLGVLRLAMGGFLRLWFRQERDAHGDVITYNNEIFKQRNLATGLFSATFYFILVAGLVEEDLLNLDDYRLEATFNMLGTWLLGAVVVLLHSWIYLGVGTRHHILHESFHDNNPAAPTSLLGLVAGMLLLNHHLLTLLDDGQHLFNTWQVWALEGVVLLAVVVLRAILQLILLAFFGIGLREQLVVKDNPAWGVLDGGLIFCLLLVLLAVLG